MTIQFNTDKSLSVSEEFRTSLTALISKDLNRFSDRITRLEVHLSDENGNKEGLADQRCMLEARLAGIQPIAVSCGGANYEIAVKGAVEKLKASLTKIVGRSQNH